MSNRAKLLALLASLLALLAFRGPWRAVGAEVTGAATADAAGSPELADPAPSQRHAAPRVSTGGLEVLALWRDGRAPIAGLWIRLAPLEDGPTVFAPRWLATDADGLARFADVPAGDVLVEGDRGGELLGLVRGGKTGRRTLLFDRGVDVTGRVLAPDGAPVAGAEVWLTRAADFLDGCAVARTDAAGRYSIRGVVAGARRIAARDPRFAPSPSHPIAAGLGAAIALDLVLGRPAAVLAGRVIDAGGRPLAGVEVVAGALDAGSTASAGEACALTPDGIATHSDARGEFELGGLRDGESWVEAHAPGFLPATARVTLTGGARAQIELALARGATLGGVARLAHGAPARGARISVSCQAARELVTTVCAADGSFRLEGLTPGIARVAAEWNGEQWAAASLELAGELARWEPTLEPGRSLAGRVLDARGVPLADLSVELERNAAGDEPLRRVARTDEAGRFWFAGLADRTHALRVWADSTRGFALARLDGLRPQAGELVVRIDDARVPSVRIRGRVLGPDGAPALDASVRPLGADPEVARAAPVDADGRFELGPLPAGEWGLLVESAAAAPHAEPARALERDQVWDAGTLVLARGETLSVRFSLPDGAVAEPVFVAHALDAPLSDWLTVAGGVARSRPLPPGRYRVAVEASDVLAADAREVDLVAGRGAELVLPLRRGVQVVLRPSPEARRLRLFHPEGRLLLERELGGARELSVCLAPGRYLCETLAQDGADAVESIEVGPDSRAGALDVIME